jgi:hypothetical protein
MKLKCVNQTFAAKDVVEVSGEFEIGSQYHYNLETQSVLARPGISSTN